MAQIEPIQPFLEPIRKSIVVQCSPRDAFNLFTAEMSAWWPTAIHSISQDRLERVVFEEKAGGSIFEVRDDGETFPWGDVVTWEPPTRFVMHWYPGREPDTAQEVELRFSKTEGGTQVHLEHRNWRSLGERAAELRDQYNTGWDLVLVEYFQPACMADF